MDVRTILRAVIPGRVRLFRVVWLRRFRDRRQGVVFAARHAPSGHVEHCWASYEREFIDYPGQERLAKAKRQNQRALAGYLDGVVIGQGEVFSVWQCAGPPTAKKGYAEAAALKNGLLTYETGGAICLLSTVLYNVGLLAGLEVVERHCHSVDSYGERRYFELGRDAAIEYGYLDLRFRNQFATDLEIRVTVTDSAVEASIWASTAKPFDVHLAVSEPEDNGRNACGWDAFRVRTRRLILADTMPAVEEDLGYSVHRIPPR